MNNQQGHSPNINIANHGDTNSRSRARLGRSRESNHHPGYGSSSSHYHQGASSASRSQRHHSHGSSSHGNRSYRSSSSSHGASSASRSQRQSNYGSSSSRSSQSHSRPQSNSRRSNHGSTNRHQRQQQQALQAQQAAARRAAAQAKAAAERKHRQELADASKRKLADDAEEKYVNPAAEAFLRHPITLERIKDVGMTPGNPHITLNWDIYKAMVKSGKRPVDDLSHDDSDMDKAGCIEEAEFISGLASSNSYLYYGFLQKFACHLHSVGYLGAGYAIRSFSAEIASNNSAPCVDVLVRCSIVGQVHDETEVVFPIEIKRADSTGSMPLPLIKVSTLVVIQRNGFSSWDFNMFSPTVSNRYVRHLYPGKAHVRNSVDLGELELYNQRVLAYARLKGISVDRAAAWVEPVLPRRLAAASSSRSGSKALPAADLEPIDDDFDMPLLHRQCSLNSLGDDGLESLFAGRTVAFADEFDWGPGFNPFDEAFRQNAAVEAATSLVSAVAKISSSVASLTDAVAAIVSDPLTRHPRRRYRSERSTDSGSDPEEVVKKAARREPKENE